MDKRDDFKQLVGKKHQSRQMVKELHSQDSSYKKLSEQLQDEINKRKRAEEELSERVRVNQILLDNFPCVALLLHSQTREIIASNATAAAAGATPGNTCFRTWGQSEKPCPWCLAPEAWATGQERHLEVEGLGRIWDAHWIPITEDLYMHYAFDITERKQDEDELEKHRTHLEELVKTRTAELTKVNEKLKQEITERKQVDKELFASEQDYRLLIDNQTDMTVKFDLQGHLLFVSPSYCKTFGKTQEELIGKKFMPLIHPDDTEKVSHAIENINKPPYSVYVEERAMTTDGWQWQGWQNTAILNEQKEVIEIVAVGRDITERKQAEEKLRLRSEIIANMTEGVYLVRFEDGIIVYTNPAFERIFGYGPDEMVGKHVSIVNAPSDKDTEEKAREIIEVMDKTGIWHGEIQNIRKDGTTFWCFAHVTVFDHSEHGKVCVTVHTDITERKQAEEELLRYASIVSSSSDMMAIFDTNFVYLAVNEAYLAAFGLAKDQVIGHSVSDVFGQELFEETIKPNARHCLEGEKVSYEDWFHFPVSGSKFMSISYSPFIDSDGEIKGFVVNSHDITGRKDVENALQAKTHDLGERVKELNCLFDLSKLVETHDSLEEIFQGIAELIPPGWQYPEITCCRITALGSEFKSGDFEQTQWKQSSDIFVDGQLSGRIEVFYKQQRQEEDEGLFLKEERNLIDALAERLSRVIERKQAIQKAHMHQLEIAHASRVNSIGEMASSLAHEINHPLFVMQGQAERSSKLLKSDSRNIETVIGKMQIIIEQAARAQKIISRIRGFVKKGISKRQKVSLNVLINNSVNLLEDIIKHKKIELRLDLANDDLEVNTDPIQIEQVIVNLINNSIDALDGTSNNKRQISITSSVIEGYAEVRIRDNGKGVTSKEMQDAFDSFYTTKSEGLGIGLSISRSIVESLGGRIGLESNSDKGVTSYFTLPINKAE